MRKEPIAIISTDKHLQEANALELLDIAEQEIALAQEQGVDTVIWLGDIFDSRLSQRQELLTCLTEMIELYHEHGITLLCFVIDIGKHGFKVGQNPPLQQFLYEFSNLINDPAHEL